MESPSPYNFPIGYLFKLRVLPKSLTKSSFKQLFVKNRLSSWHLETEGKPSKKNLKPFENTFVAIQKNS